MALHFKNYWYYLLSIQILQFRVIKKRVCKLKDNKGWESFVKNSKYDVDKYLFKINNKRLQELFIKNLSNNDVEKTIIHLVFDINLQKQYNKILKKFKVPTILYTRLDLYEKLVIKHNYNRKDIAKIIQ